MTTCLSSSSTWGIQVARHVWYRTVTSAASTVSRRRNMLDRIIRVDHAGELAASSIYEGQMALLGNTPAGLVIQVSEKNNIRNLTFSVTKFQIIIKLCIVFF